MGHEQTPKVYKLHILLAALFFFGGMLALLAIPWLNLGTPLRSATALGLVVLGLVWFVITKAVLWWKRG